MSYWDKTLLVGLGAVGILFGVRLSGPENFSLAMAAVFVGGAVVALGLFQGVQVAVRRATGDAAAAAEADHES